MIRDVRGLGLMNGVELYEADGTPGTALSPRSSLIAASRATCC